MSARAARRSLRTATAVLVMAAGAMAGAFTLAAPPVLAQEADRLQRARAALPPAVVPDFDREIAAARSAGLPTEPLVNKVLEGVAKSFPPDRIMAVVARTREDLGRARSLLVPGPEPSAADLVAVAQALARGTPGSAIRALREEAPNEPIALTAVTLADLVERGVPPGLSLDLIRAWRARGGEPAELPELPAAVERMIRRGEPPAQAAANVLNEVRRGRPPGAVGRPAGVGRPPGAGPPSSVGRPAGVGRPPHAGPPPDRNPPGRGRPRGGS